MSDNYGVDMDSKGYEEKSDSEVIVKPVRKGRKIWDSWDIPDGRIIRPSKRKNMMRHDRIHKTAMILDPYEYAIMDKRDTVLSRRVLEKELRERTAEATVRRRMMLNAVSDTAHKESEKVERSRELRNAREAASQYHAMETKIKSKVHHTMNILEASGIGAGQTDATYVHTLHRNGMIESYALTRPKIHGSDQKKGNNVSRIIEEGNQNVDMSESEQISSEADIVLKPTRMSLPTFSFMYIKYEKAIDPEIKEKVFARLTPVKHRKTKKALLKYLDERYASHKFYVSNISKKVKISMAMHFLLCASNRRRQQLVRMSIANRADNRMKWAQLIHKGHINDIRGVAGYMLHKSWKGHYKNIEREIERIEDLKTRLKLKDLSQNVRMDYFTRMMRLTVLKNYIRRSTALRCRAIYDKMYMKLSECLDDTLLPNIQNEAENLTLLCHHEARTRISKIDVEMLRLKKIYKVRQTFSRSIKTLGTD